MNNLQQAFSNDVNMDMGSYSASGFDPIDVQTTSGMINEHDAAQRVDISDIDPNAVGGGPLPAGFGVSMPQQGTSTLTEFTKRRNWSQRVIEEIKDALIVITPEGRVVYTSPSMKTLTSFTPEELQGKFFVEYLHSDDASCFIREFVSPEGRELSLRPYTERRLGIKAKQMRESILSFCLAFHSELELYRSKLTYFCRTRA